MVDIVSVEAIEQIKSIEKRIEFIQQFSNANYQNIKVIADLSIQSHDINLIKQTIELQNSHPNPLNKFGKKCFSQTDEDGLTLEIIKRLKIKGNGIFAEFGVGNGLENNTLILAALGWHGFWVGGEDLAIKIEPTKNFTYIKSWITLDNIIELAQSGLNHLGVDNVDVASLDLDGNDIHFVQKLLESGVTPKLFIVEYNGKFPPPVKFKITYDPNHRWVGDDYFGASLASFVELFAKHNYKLVCCNTHTGANAFFVHSDYAASFKDVPADIQNIYVAPRYHLHIKYGHRPSVRVVEEVFKAIG